MAKRSSRDASEQLSRIYTFSKDALETVATETKELQQAAREWVPKHRGVVIAVSSTALGAGLVGYLAGRRGGAQRARQAAEAARHLQVPELDIAPFLKILKLWMLYRVATRI